MAPPCVSMVRGSGPEMTLLSFDNATLLVSNLGGLGGQLAPEAGAPPVVRYGGVARLQDGTSVDLQVSNATEYRAFSTLNNGIKLTSNGSFGVLNLLAPRSSEVTATWVQLRFSFVDSLTSEPITLERTHVTFYDFDSSRKGVRECVQANGSVVGVSLTDDTELEQIGAGSVTMAEIASAQPVQAEEWVGGGEGTTHVYCSTTMGVGADNPIDPYEMDEVPRSRSIMLHFASVSSFDIRYSLSGATATGRNMLFAGYSDLGEPLCDLPPPSPPPTPPTKPPLLPPPLSPPSTPPTPSPPSKP